MIVTPAEMLAIEEAAFAAGATAESLMNQIGRQIALRVVRLASQAGGTVLVYAGKGNNAGDALEAARFIRQLQREQARESDLNIKIILAAGAGLGVLPRKKLDALPEADYPRLTAGRAGAASGGNLFILDGLLGIGARGPLRESIRGAAREINDLRRTRGACVIAIDGPTGLDAETGEADPDAVVADETLAAGFAKTGWLADGAANCVGRIEVLDLPDFATASEQAPAAAARGQLSVARTLAGLLPPRPCDSHKGLYGRVGILAGSVGATGAAVMCSHACARAGAGLITLLVHPGVYEIVAGAAAPEVMVKPLRSPADALEMEFDVLALGPGLGSQDGDAVRDLIERWPKPMVIDADGLNALSSDMNFLTRASGPRLLTPHPGEMKRLLEGDARRRGVKVKETSRLETVREFVANYPVTLLLKGARTLVCERGRVPAYNTTGNPGMATGGMGDVLTGICAALAGQKLALYDAARLGAWLHGLAADLAIGHGSGARGEESEQSLLPTDLFKHFGEAFRELSRYSPAEATGFVPSDGATKK